VRRRGRDLTRPRPLLSASPSGTVTGTTCAPERAFDALGHAATEDRPFGPCESGFGA
jgi:hypothetical protein